MQKTIFVCESCGEEFLTWSGKCSSCGSWNTIKEISLKTGPKTHGKQRVDIKPPEKLKDIKISQYHRLSSFSSEFNRVLGDGIVPGSVILLGGEPGIGKSTLVLQIASKIQNDNKNSVLYVSGEESKEQIKMRADRLGIKTENTYILCETNIDAILEAADKFLVSSSSLSLLVIDSIQTMYDEEFPSTPGSIVQVRETAMQLQQYAKQKNIPIILVGHVTKEGSVAGPKILEHLVDVVLYLEGDRFANLRILQSIKNRFGATQEVGVFEMAESGMIEVKNPSKLFLQNYQDAPGTAITSILSGTRSFLIEIQTLITKSPFGYPKRVASGFDLRRLDLLLAVLEKRMEIPLNLYDVYVNIIGGMKIDDRAADLAICASIYSIFQNQKIKEKTVFIGEVGLSGEIRNINQLEKRKKEAKALGFNNIIDSGAKTLNNALKLTTEI